MPLMDREMEEYLNASTFKTTKGSVITIGTFDGVHIGHRAIIDRVIHCAKQDNRTSVLLTFFPHPRMVLQEKSEIKLINTLAEKKQLLDNAGLDAFVVEPFTHKFSRLTALEYVRDILVKKLHAKKIIIGYDHRFGRNRNANIVDLRAFGKEFGFEVEEISAQQLEEVSVSSTKIRKALNEGDIATANNYLGYPYTITGTVVNGKAIGRTIAYPTANLSVKESYKLIPKAGVYIVKSIINNNIYYGITSIGTNPTLGNNAQTIETYFLNFKGDLYNQPLSISFLEHIRNEATFKDVEALKLAIQKDESFAKNYIAQLE